MRKVFLLLTAIAVLGLFVQLDLPAFAAYRLSTTTATSWDGTYANRLKAPTDDYKHTYGDEASITYNLPWPFTFYGQTYSQGSPITIDTNGNIWFAASGSANSFTLANTGRGPVIAAWNNDLSSHFHGGAFVQRMTGPDRVVVEWQTETYTDEGAHRVNDFEAVLFPNGNIRFDYAAFDTSNGRDYGSGISKGDGTANINLSTIVAFAPTLAGRSFAFTELPPALNVLYSGTGEGVVTSTPDGINCGANCTASFTLGTSVSLHAEPSQYSLFTGWTIGQCTGTSDCGLTMNDDATTTALFTRDIAHQVSIGGSTTHYYSSIQEAYNAAADSDVIRIWAVVYNEDVTCNRPIGVVFQGGYDSGYSTIVGDIVLSGTLTVTDGAVIADGLAIK
jgi:hypothetical protein